MNKVKATLLSFILIFLFNQSKSQTSTPFSFGLGLKTKGYLTRSPNYFPPGAQANPYLNFRIKQHELLMGPDIYQSTDGLGVFGGQLSYRYHIPNQDKSFHLFIDCNFQYSIYQLNCVELRHYGDKSPSNKVYYDCGTGDYKSFVNTFGIGIQKDFFKRFSMHAIIGAGYIYSEGKGFEGDTGKAFEEYKTKFLGTIQLGFSYNIYQKSKPATN